MCPVSTHGSTRLGGLACDECERRAFDLLAGVVGQFLSTFGQCAYEARRARIPETQAAIMTLRKVGEPIGDGLGAELLLRELR